MPELEPDWALLPATVLQVLGGHLSRAGLKSSLQLCKSWREPIRYATSEFSTCFVEADVQYHDEIEVLTTATETKLASIASAFPKLNKLIVTFQGDSALASAAAAAACLPHHFPSLPALEVFLDSPLDFDHEMEPILVPLAAMPCLTALVLHVVNLHSAAWFHTSLSKLSQLQTLVMHLEFATAVHDMDATVLATLSLMQHFELHVRYEDVEPRPSSDAFVTASVLRKLGSAWPHLKKLLLTAAPWEFEETFSEGLCGLTHLEALGISLEDPYNHGGADAWAATVAACHLPTSIRAVSLCNVTFTVQDYARPLQRLQSLELLGCNFSLPAVMRMLQLSPGLQNCTVDLQPLLVHG